MKTKYVVLLVLTFIGMESMAQSGHLYPGIMPNKENGYTSWEIERFALGGSLLSQDYRPGFVARVKKFCEDVGIYPTDENGNPLRTDEDWVRWAYSPVRTWAEDRSYDNGYWNSHQSSNGQKVVLYWDKRPFHGPVLVLHEGGYELDLNKASCANFVKVPYVVKKKEQIPIQQRQPSGTFDDRRNNVEEFDNGWRQIGNSPDQIQNTQRQYPLIPEEPKTKKVADWGKIATIGGISVGVGLATLGGILLVKALKDKGDGTTTGGGPVTNGSHESGVK